MKIDSSLMFEPARVGAMATMLEDAGFDGAYTFEGQSDPFTSVAAAAMQTQRLELMTSIAVAFARNPMSLAYLGNDLQNLSQGRFILGLGTQANALLRAGKWDALTDLIDDEVLHTFAVVGTPAEVAVQIV